LARKQVGHSNVDGVKVTQNLYVTMAPWRCIND